MPAERRHLPAFTSPAQQQTKQRGNDLQFHPSAPEAGTFAKGNAACYGLRLSHVPCVALLAAAVLRSNGIFLNAPHAPFYPDLLRVSSGKHSPGGVYGRSFYEWMGYNKKLPSTFTFGNGAALWRNPSRPVRFILLVGVARLFRQAERGACLCRTCRSPSASISKACKEKLVMQLRANRMHPKEKQMPSFWFGMHLGIPALIPIGLSLYIAVKRDL